MNKLSKIALLVSSVVSTQAFSADAGKLDVEVYAKAGITSQLDADEQMQLDTRTDDGVSAYQDSKVGLKLGYGINKHFSVHSEIRSDYEGKEMEVRLPELYVKAEIGKIDIEAGRFRTPLYMNSKIQDNDFELNTYRGVRGFGTNEESSILSALESTDGISIGFNNDLSFGKTEVRAFGGQAKDRQGAFYNDSLDETIEFETTAENIWGLESKLTDTEFGSFRLAYVGAEISSDDVIGDEVVELDSISFGYKFSKGMFFTDAEVAMEDYTTSSSLVEEQKVEVRKGYVTFGLDTGAFVPSLTYSTEQIEFTNEDTESVELGFAYKAHKNVRIKAAYEYIETGDDFDDTVVSLGAAFKF